MNENDEIQKELFKNVINIILEPIGIQISEIEDLKIETTFPQLAQFLLKDEITGWKKIPESWKEKSVYKKRIQEQEENNFISVINYLALKDKSFKNFGIPRTTKDMISFIWSFLSKFYIVLPKKNLISLLSQHLQEFEPNLQIKNMVSSFSNGVPYIAILSKASKGVIQFIDKGNPEQNFEYIINSCQSLNIPFILPYKCISSKLDENCNCIQSVIMLKYIGLYDSVVSTQISKTKEDDMKKFDEKINEYKENVQNAIKIIDDEQKQFDKIKDCFSQDDINIKKKHIHQYNLMKRKKIQEITFKCDDLWNNLLRNSNRIKIDIPSDLVKINILQQKFNDLEKNVSNTQSMLQTEEANIKAIFLDIPKIQTIPLLREKINKLNKEYDMTNWRHHNQNSFAYILYDRLENYENIVNNSLKNHENCMKKFENDFKTISNKIENKTGQMIELNNYIFQLKCSLKNSKDDINTIQKYDPSYQINFDPIDSQKKIDLANKMVKDFKCIRDEIDFNSNVNAIIQKLQEISELIKTTKEEYNNYYSRNIMTEFRTKIHIKFPDISELYSEKIKNILEETKDELKQLNEFLVKREKQSINIEDNSLSLKNEYLEIKKNICLLNKISFYQLQNARKHLKNNEKVKQWDKNAYGSSIDIYNQNMKDSYELDQIAVEKLNMKMDKRLNKILESLSEIQSHTKCPLNTILDYDKHFREIDRKRDEIIFLLDVDNEMKFNKKNWINEIMDKISKKEEEIKNLYAVFPNQMSQFLDNEYQLKSSMLKEKLKNDTLNANKLNAYEIDKNGIDLMPKYHQFLLCKDTIDKINQKYNMNVKMPENMIELMNVLCDSIIIYRSTLMLNPKSFSSLIMERIQYTEDPNFSYLMAVLYVYKFSNDKNNIYGIQNVIEAKKDIESLSNNNRHKMEFDFICRRFFHDDLETVEFCLMADFIIYFEELFQRYLIRISLPKPSSFIEDMEEKIKSKNISQPKLIEIIENYNKCMDSRGKKCEIIENNFNNDNNIVVIDFGSYKTKIGFAFYEMPKQIRTAIGKHKNENTELYGYSAISPFVNFIFPVKKGIIDRWDAIEQFYQYTFKELTYYNYSDFPVIISNTVFNNKKQPEKIIQIMFETYNVPAFYMNNSSVFSVYSSGSDTRMSVEIGYETTRFSPVYEGHDISLLSQSEYYGGNTINELIKNNVVMYDYYTSSVDEMKFIEDFKRKACYVPLDFEKEKEMINDKSWFETNCPIRNDKYFHSLNGAVLYPEVFFQPQLFDIGCNGMSQKIIDIIHKIDIDFRSNFCKNIVLSGSTSFMKNLKERLHKELNGNGLKDYNLIRPKQAGYSAWYGAATLANLPIFSNLAVTSDEYHDDCVSIVNRKCF